MSQSNVFVLVVLTTSMWGAPTRADDRSVAANETTNALTPEARQAVQELDATLPEDSEARAMIESILRDEMPSIDTGWFAVATPQTRFDWEHVAGTYDTDGNDSVSLSEFTGSDADFERLDRNSDRQVTSDDLDFQNNAGDKSPGRLLFTTIDRDGDGKLTREELNTWFDARDTDSHDFLAMDDLRDEPLIDDRDSRRRPRPEHPSVSTLVLSVRNQEMGSLQSGPNVDEIAPDFTLRSLDGEVVTLSEQVGDQPIVLIFGNFTCGPFRGHAGDFEKMYERYQDRAKFYLVYVRETHPEDGWFSRNNRRYGIEISQPTNNGERLEVAQMCQQHLDLDLPFLVDTTDDAVGAAYSGMPNRLYLIDSEGRIAFKNGRGPFWLYPRQLEQALILLLAEQDG